MEQYWLVLVFVLGCIIGSFLNVVLYRMHTGRSINGRSHCMSCGETLKWYELFPILSYLALSARCRSCSAYIPIRYLAVELLTGLVFLALYVLFQNDIARFILHAILGALLILIAVYDLRHTIIPNELSVMVGGVALLMVGYDYLHTREVMQAFSDVLAGGIAGFFFYALWYVSKGKWIGLGDAKLALPLGIIAGVSGALSMVVLSFWIGAGVSVLLLFISKLLEKGKTVLHFIPSGLTMKSEVPFAPFLIVGFLLAHLFHADIFVITSYLIPL
jgi:leader peptidase (prepilin peptidase) / N-methyltransferase